MTGDQPSERGSQRSGSLIYTLDLKMDERKDNRENLAIHLVRPPPQPRRYSLSQLAYRVLLYPFS